jgi:SAM-dependent methyltransferase
MANKEKNIDAGKFNDQYGIDYLSWKKWGSDFARLNNTEFAYFSTEISRLNNNLPVNVKALEIGFGNGAFLRYAQRMGWDICGTEVNEALVSIALQSGFNVSHTADLLQFSDNSFDLLVAFDVLEHIPQDDLPKFFSEVKRILKIDGFFIARFPNGDSPLGLMHQNSDVTHVTTIGSGKIRYYAAKTNMKLFFIGGEAQPLFGGTLLHFIHRIFSLPIKKVTNLFINLIFFPGARIHFCSSNLIAIFRKN